ncbi:MAG: hypothetical protein R3A10_06855 [Caldilineaceae bacterium]
MLNTGIVSKTVDGFAWNPAALTEDGELAKEHVTVQDPSKRNCGQCHGVVHDDLDVPLVLDDVGLDTWSTLTTGQIFSPQRLAESGMNLADKADLSQPGTSTRSGWSTAPTVIFAQQSHLLRGVPGVAAGAPDL